MSGDARPPALRLVPRHQLPRRAALDSATLVRVDRPLKLRIAIAAAAQGITVSEWWRRAAAAHLPKKR